jgi:hypothetical protein
MPAPMRAASPGRKLGSSKEHEQQADRQPGPPHQDAIHEGSRFLLFAPGQWHSHCMLQ